MRFKEIQAMPTLLIRFTQYVAKYLIKKHFEWKKKRLKRCKRLAKS